MIKPEPPCHYCPKRTGDCHKYCKTYKEYERACIEYRASVFQSRILDAYKEEKVLHGKNYNKHH